MNGKAIEPKLRFPEFREAGEWEEELIGQISENVTAGGTPSTSEKEYWGGSIRWMNSGELNHKKVHEVQGRITEKGLRNSSTKIIPKMCVLIGLAGQGKTRGTVAMNMVELCINQSIAAIFPNEENFSSDFLYHNLDNRYDELRKLSAGGEGRGGLNLQIIKSLRVPLPRLKEQQKIADCLSSLDELITAQTQKLDTLKTHKKGLMQQLFPAEGETLPKLRFPEFRDAGEWVEKPLGAICKIKRGKFSHRPRNDPRFFGGRYPFIQTGDVVKSDGGPVQASQALNELGLSVSKLFKPTIVLITIAANIGDTGILDQEACFTDSVVGLIPNKGISPYFLQLSVRGKKEYLNKIAPAAAQKNINNEILSVLPILVPGFDEQKCIASCLTSLDELITAQTQKLDTLKVHKKGLMQLLFPSLEEVGV